MKQLELPFSESLPARRRLHLLAPFPVSDPDSPDPVGLYLSRLPHAPTDDPAFERWGLGPVHDVPRSDLGLVRAEDRVSTIFLGQLR